MATSMGSRHTSIRTSAAVPCSLERVAQLACHAFDVPVAWVMVDGALRVATSPDAASSDAPAFAPDTLRALFEAAAPDDTSVTIKNAADEEGDGFSGTGLQFLAVAPILNASKRRVGSLCIADSCLRSLTDREVKHLETLAALAGSCLHRAEEYQSAHHLHRVVQQTDHGIVVTDPSGRVTWVNEGFEQLCGYTLDEFRGKKPGALLQGPRTDEDVVATVRGHIQAGEGFSAELINYRKSGEPYWVHIQAEPIVDQQGTVIGFFALETDVSERKALEETLRVERDLLATTIDTVEALVVVFDPDARIVRFNEACRRVTGYASQDVIGERATDVLIPEDERSKVEAALEAHRAGKQQSAFECYWLTKSGERRLIDWSNTVITDGQGNLQYVLGTGIDITERRQLEQQIIRVSEEERQRIGQDLHDILASHLAGTAMIAKSLIQQLDHGRSVTTDDLNVVVKQIQKASQQARALSHSLMPLRLECSSLQEALQRLVDDKQELTGLPHTIEADADLPRIDDTTAMHLYRIAYEAINNAAKHAKPGRVEVGLSREGDDIVLTVRDDGVGIPSSVDPVGGLGLHMMHHRADVIGAELRIDSVEEGGTIVRCIVPIDVAASAAAR